MMVTRFALCLLLISCAAGQKLEEAAKAASTYVHVTEPIVAGAYEAEQRICLDAHEDKQGAAACVEGVRAKWKPVLEALRIYREAWCVTSEAVNDVACPAAAKRGAP